MSTSRAKGTDRDEWAASVSFLASKFTPLSASSEAYVSQPEKVQKDLADVFRHVSPNSCFVQLFDQKPFPAAPVTKCPPPAIVLAETVMGTADPVAALVDVMTLTDEEVQAVADNTKAQSKSDVWKQHRRGRITASISQRVYTRVHTLRIDPSADANNLVSTIMGYKKEFTNQATKHGLSMEHHASRMYLKIMKRTHKKFHVLETGLVICKTETYLAASPDLITHCICHGKGLCEIKCPYVIRDAAPTTDNYQHVDSDGHLSKTSPHYFQVMMQLAILDLPHCDYFVYTSHGYLMDRVQFDTYMWQDMLERLRWFWTTCVAPEMLFHKIRDTRETVDTDQPIEDDLTDARQTQPLTSNATASSGPLCKPHFPLLYLCPVCKRDCEEEPLEDDMQSVECSECGMWYHYACAGFACDASISTSTWHCASCIEVSNAMETASY